LGGAASFEFAPSNDSRQARRKPCLFVSTGNLVIPFVPATVASGGLALTLQEEKDTLLRVVTKLALKMITEGGFYPFGAVMGPGRSAKIIMPKSWEKDAPRDEIEAYWAGELQKAVSETRCRTVCWCADVHLPNESGDSVPFVLIHVEQPSIAEDMGYPYLKHGNSKVELGTPTIIKTKAQVFADTQS
jgi:hypothetical protein